MLFINSSLVDLPKDVDKVNIGLTLLFTLLRSTERLVERVESQRATSVATVATAQHVQSSLATSHISPPPPAIVSSTLSNLPNVPLVSGGVQGVPSGGLQGVHFAQPPDEFADSHQLGFASELDKTITPGPTPFV